MCTKLIQHMDSAKRAIDSKGYFDFDEHITSALHMSQNAEPVKMLYIHGLMEFGNFKKALEVIDRLLQKPALSAEERCELLEQKAIALRKQADFKSAKLIYDQLCKSGMAEYQMNAYENLVSMYIDQYLCEGMSDQGLLNEAVANAYKALELINTHYSKEVHEKLLLNLGFAHWYNKNLSKALDVINHAFQLSDGGNYRALIYMAEIYISFSDYDSAMECIEKADSLCVSDSYCEGYIKAIQAHIYNDFDDLSQARECLTIAYDKFVHAGALYEAGYCLKRSLDLDHLITTEAIGLMMSKLNAPIAKACDMKATKPLGIRHLSSWLN